ncbi:MAG: acyltransferase, partial [Verrucomicrobiaceae bacterium]|nr:acyltransferase [Verrucomicrobiaceae bacterium]
MTARPSRLISLDLLRAVAIILTVLHHCMGHLDFGPYAPPRSGLFLGITHAGWIGVPMFFVLSGFLICHLLMRE